MKRLLPILLMLCLLAGCADGGLHLPADPAAEETVTQQPVIPVPDEATVRNRFEKAAEVYGWVDLCALPVDSSQTYTVGERTYYHVVSDEVPDYNALRTVVYDLFSTDIGEQLLCEGSETPPYISVEGKLYGMDGARGADITKGDYTLTVETENSTSVLCKVEVELVEFDYDGGEDYRKVVGTESHTFHYNLVGNRWVFTDFDLWY